MNTAPPNASGNNVLAVVAAIYTVILCVMQVCAGTVAGILSGGLNSLSTAVTAAGGTIEGDLASATGATGIVAILLVVVGLAMLFAAVGVFMRRPWAWMLMIGTHAAYAILAVLSGGLSTIVGIIFVVLSVGVVGLFLTQTDIKRALNVA